MKTILLAALLLAILIGALWFSLSRSVAVKIVDEEGHPLPGIEVNFEFEISTPNSSPFSKATGRTNSAGEASARGIATSVGYYIDVPGYYRTLGQSIGEGTPIAVLKKIENPKAMYARYESYQDMGFPNDGQPHSFDLEIGDWLPPTGHGIIPDFTFRVTGYRRSGNDQDDQLNLTFSNPDDGIQPVTVEESGSILRLPKLAPDSGYQNQWIWRTVIRPEQKSGERLLPSKANQAYFFRVRTRRDKSGGVVGLYGKISRDIDYGAGENGAEVIQIASYYLNPDGSRTMEFDVSKNLATGPPAKAVRDP